VADSKREFTKKAAELKANDDTANRWMQIVAEHRIDDADRLFGALPKKTRLLKMVLASYLALLLETDRPTFYCALVDEFRRSSTQRVPTAWMLGYYRAKGDYRDAARVIDEIDRQVGGDPFLDTERNLPDCVETYEAVLGIVLERKEHVRVSAAMRKLVHEFGYDYAREDVAAEPVFANWLESDEGKAFFDR
jgi:hypothetical protein